MRYLALFLFFFIATPAFAQVDLGVSATINPVSFGINDSFTLTLDCNGSTLDFVESIVFNPDGVALNGYGTLNCTSTQKQLTTTYNSFNEIDFWLLDDIPSYTTLFGTYTILARTNYLLNTCAQEYDGITEELEQCLTEFISLATFELIPDTAIVSNVTWGSNNGFFGNSTPAQVGASVIDGVQDTGANLWPLLIFLGVSIAFIIFIQVIALTKHTTRINETKRRKRPY